MILKLKVSFEKSEFCLGVKRAWSKGQVIKGLRWQSSG